jgi:hypothetical protein
MTDIFIRIKTNPYKSISRINGIATKELKKYQFKRAENYGYHHTEDIDDKNCYYVYHYRIQV